MANDQDIWRPDYILPIMGPRQLVNYKKKYPREVPTTTLEILLETWLKELHAVIKYIDPKDEQTNIN